jgi:tetratricopeptide (TPR) repeat protein
MGRDELTRTVYLLFGVTWFVVLPHVARAELATEAQARVHHERGFQLAEVGRYEEALVEFEEVLRLLPRPSARFNRARCLESMGRNTEALAAFEQYLELHGREITREQRVDAEGRIARLRRLTGQPLVVPPQRPAPVVPAVQPAPLATGAVPVQETPAHHEGGRGLRIASYISLGVAVASLGAALGLYLWNDSRYGEWSDEDGALRAAYSSPEQDPSDEVLYLRLTENNDLADSLAQVDVISWVVFGVGVAALAAGTGLLIAGLTSRRSPRVSVATGPSGFVMALSWRLP